MKNGFPVAFSPQVWFEGALRLGKLVRNIAVPYMYNNRKIHKQNFEHQDLVPPLFSAASSQHLAAD